MQTTNSERIVIGNSKIEDLDNLWEIERLSWSPERRISHEELVNRLNVYPEGFLSALYDGKTAGFSNAFLIEKLWSIEDLEKIHNKTSLHNPSNPQFYYVHMIVVHPQYRNRNIGSSLLNAHDDRARNLRYDKVFLLTEPDLRNFYEKNGYETDGKFSRYHNTKMAWFWKKLF